MIQPIAVVSLSGGKDSNATALVAIERFGRERVRLVHADTGHEHPVTEAYIRDYLPGALGLPIDIVRADFSKDIARKRTFIAAHWEAHGVPPDRVARALEMLQPTGVPFLDLCMWKGRFPSTKAQFCTQELKRRPLDQNMIAIIRAGVLAESWHGVRRDESANRRDALLWERADGGWLIHRPIADWSAADTFAVMDRHGVKPNPLYSQGMRRVGCMPCINCGKDELLQISQRWPAEIARVAKWEQVVAEVSKRGSTSFFPGIAADGPETDAELAERFSIKNKVLWAATSRGGTQFDLERAIPSPDCTSVYGLCE